MRTGVGLIEIVLNSDTTSGIQLKYGGGALGALKLDPLHKFIADHNKEPDQYESAKDNFIKVGTYRDTIQSVAEFPNTVMCRVLCRHVRPRYRRSAQRQHHAYQGRAIVPYDVNRPCETM